MMAKTGTVLIAGASGVVGNAALDRFLKDGWNVVALSRRKPESATDQPFRHIAVDLRDAVATRDIISAESEITHVVYAALFEKPGLVPGWSEQDQMQTNLAMLQNLLEPLTAASRGLQHVSLLQGTKAYGIHLHPMPIPAREASPRDDHANFYWLQEDYLKGLATAHGFSWTIFRPQLIIGGAWGAAMNLAPVVAAYAAICREEGEPFGFPGGAAYVWEAVDARVLAGALVWAAESAAAAGETYNVTNGDVFEWRNLWPTIAAALGVEASEDRPLEMAAYLPGKAAV